MAEDSATVLSNRTGDGPTGSPEDYFLARELEEGVFEIGLVLGGTVSVGTFTAGVLDFLIEALDAWEVQRKAEEQLPFEQRQVPQHRVRLRIITGTSGGGICALLAARALHYRFPHPSSDSRIGDKDLAANPFYDVWVNDIDIVQLLQNTDLTAANGSSDTPPVASLLNGHVLETVANEGLRYPSAQQRIGGPVTDEPSARGYVNNPLPLILTQTHLTGIPYQVQFRGLGSHTEYFSNHTDYVRLYANYQGCATPNQPAPLPDAIMLGNPNPDPAASRDGAGEDKPVTPWPDLAQYALGTAAFPIGLPARIIKRSAADYGYRFVFDTVSGQYQWLVPDWSKLIPDGVEEDKYSFTVLDGGCTDNEPIGLARQVLEGLKGASRISATETRRAIILVDPFCDVPPQAGISRNMSLAKLLASTLHMFVQSNRFATSELMDFLHPDVYNRFLIAPKREDPAHLGENPKQFVMGGDALAGDGLGGFLGFMSKEYRHHDFMLGRRNCQAFLKWCLTLDRSNRSFLGARPAVYPVPDGTPLPTNECPIIPLYGIALDEQGEPAWPKDTFDPATLGPTIEARLDALLAHAEDFLHMGVLIKKVATFAAEQLFMHRISGAITEAILKELRRKSLSSVESPDSRATS